MTESLPGHSEERDTHHGRVERVLGLPFQVPARPASLSRLFIGVFLLLPQLYD
jgi:hypothetical protein